MNAATSVMVSVGGLIGLGYVLKIVLPDSSIVSINWGTAQYFLPLNILGYWACIAAASVVGTVQTLRAMMRDAVRLR